MKPNVKHTPGPWKLLDAPHKGLGIVAPQANHATIVSDGLGLPDARLIAAAPELLDACKAALSAIDVTVESESPDAEVERAFGRAIELLKAAIAKAGGKP